jgi:alkylated DNA nucleotide flippase Atl1
MTVKLTHEVVYSVLDEMCVGKVATSDGFNLTMDQQVYRLVSDIQKVTHGMSSTVWRIMNQQGVQCSTNIRTLAQLRTAIREWAAGPRPPEQPGHYLYAKLNQRTALYEWIYRSKKED